MDKRTIQTKLDIADSFRKLVEEKDINKITVIDICKYAPITRNTFYYHFEDIRALLNWMMEEDCKKLLADSKDVDLNQVLSNTMKYIDENYNLLKCIISAYGSIPLEKAFTPYFKKTLDNIIRKKEAEIEFTPNYETHLFLVRFYAEAIGGLLMGYIKRESIFGKEAFLFYLNTVLESIDLRSFQEGLKRNYAERNVIK